MPELDRPGSRLVPSQLRVRPNAEGLSSEPTCLRPVERCLTQAGRKDLPRHYLRHSVLFHKAGYNLIATTTNSRPKEMTVSDTINDKPITCPSCEYRYPRSVGVCAMCGTPAPVTPPGTLSIY